MTARHQEGVQDSGTRHEETEGVNANTNQARRIARRARWLAQTRKWTKKEVRGGSVSRGFVTL